MRKMNRNEAFFSAVKFYFQNVIVSDDNLSRAAIRDAYRMAKFNAANYVFKMKSEDLTSIPVW